MVELGVEGVEAFSNYHSPETVEYFYQAGKKHQILITCGSDYHGTIDEHDIENQLKEYKLI